MRGADLLVQSLALAGVKTIYTLSGNQIMPVFDACLDAGIRLVHTRHEAAAVFMAEAHAQLTGQVGVALTTAAPGFGNALGPLYMAGMSETPVLLLSGDSPVGADGRGAFQELDQVAVASTLTKRSRRPRSVDAMGRDVAYLMRMAASGRPGPVHMALPFDLLNAEISDSAMPVAADFVPDIQGPSADALAALQDRIAKAARPLIITGPLLNATRAPAIHAALSDVLDAPLVSMESPRGLNDPSLGAFAGILSQADLVVSLGKNIDFTTGFGATPAWSADGELIMVDPDAEVLERARRAMGARLVQSIAADAPATAAALAGQSALTTDRSAWREEVAGALRARAPEPAVTDTSAMRPAAVCAQIQDVLDKADDAILIIDGGEVGQWAQACLSAPRRIINGPSGAIGGCLCYAVAAKVSNPDATVIVFMGDGTAGFHFAEFETAHRAGADFVAVIGHDAKWNAEYQIQLREYGENRLYECELNPTRYDEAAAGLGCHGEHAVTPEEVADGLRRALASGKPACLVAEIEGLPAPGGAKH
jgi:acetolactate synthase-1/2/3 large subunit